MKEDETTVVVGQFTLSAQLQGGKNITVLAHLYSGETKEAINDRLDLLSSVIDRQRTLSEIPEIEAQVEKQQLQLGQALESMNELLEAKKNGAKLTTTQQQHLKTMETNLKVHKDNIDRGEAAIKLAKEKVK